jgi:hypothetical protein
VLGVLLALLGVAVLLALWFLLFAGDDANDSAAELSTAAPTAIALPTMTAIAITDDGSAAAPATTTVPLTTPTPVPEGFEACAPDRLPSTTGTYVVDTNTTPLNQRSEPAVGAELAGTFAPGQTGLSFTGNCVVNLGDGYVWWEIDNGTENVWIASDFVTPG